MQKSFFILIWNVIIIDQIFQSSSNIFFFEFTKKERIKELKCSVFNDVLHVYLINIKKIHNALPALNPLHQLSPTAASKNQPLPSYFTKYPPFVFTLKYPSSSNNSTRYSSLSRTKGIVVSCWFLLSLFSWYKLSPLSIKTETSDESVDGENDDDVESSFDRNVIRFYK